MNQVRAESHQLGHFRGLQKAIFVQIWKLSLCLLSTNRKIGMNSGLVLGMLAIILLYFLQDNSIQQFNSTNIY